MRQDSTSFLDELGSLASIPIDTIQESITVADVERVLLADRIGREGFMILLSSAAGRRLEAMAQQAHSITVRNFGRVILLYTPLYLANHCDNSCPYCGFSAHCNIDRRRLSLSEVEAEAEAIAETGLRHLLVLTGDSRTESPLGYILDCVGVLRRRFSSVSAEIYPLTQPEYEELVRAGVDGLTIYQETYDRGLYSHLHSRGPKRDYRFRLDAPERACLAGMRTVNVGALLGLTDWRKDAFFAGLHAAYLQRRFPEGEVCLSLPRLRPHSGAFTIPIPVDDCALVQILLAFRLFLPRVGISLSTRESARFRDHVVPLGVTRMSAGSRTQVGGHVLEGRTDRQFDVSDDRTVLSVKESLERIGMKPIFKDWHALDAHGPQVVEGRSA